MRRFTLLVSALLWSIFSTQAQTVATFDTLSLPGADTFYVNYSDPGEDVGFDDGNAHFTCVYDTGFGSKFLSYGFVYSNMKDSVTSGFGNQFAAKTAGGFNGSDQYIISFGSGNKVFLKGSAAGKPVYGFYVTNSTYAYNSMRDGDAFSKKFGGASGNDSDWFKLTIKGYRNGAYTPDSVDILLADFRSPDNTKDSILKYWKWVNLLPLGNVDSLEFNLSSSDTGQFGMNTPAYFCMDNFSTKEPASVRNTPGQSVARIYPNPASDRLFVQLNNEKIKQLNIMDMAGRIMISRKVQENLTSVDVTLLPAGSYILQLAGEEQNAAVRFVKQ